MKCKRRQLKIIKKDGENLTAVEQRHLEYCPDCREFMADLSNFHNRMSAFQTVEPNAVLDARIKAQARRQNMDSSAPAISFPLFRIAFPAATVLLVMALWFLLSPWPRQSNDLVEISSTLLEETTALHTIIEQEIAEAEREAWGAALSRVPGEYMLEPAAAWNYELEQEIWLLEAELYAEHQELQEYSKLWLAEVE